MIKKILFITPVLILITFGLWIIFGGHKATAPTGMNVDSGVSPFGSGEGVPGPQNGGGTEGRLSPINTDPSGTAKINALFKVSSSPVAGFTVLSRASSTVIRYVERATGHVFDAVLPKGENVMNKTRLTNKTLPQIYEAYFRADGDAVLMRSIDNNGAIRNLSFKLLTAASSSEISGIGLRGNMDGISVGDGNTLYYSLTDSSAIVSSTFTGDGLKTIWTSPLKSWQTAPLGKSVLIFNKPSFTLPGVAYALNQGSLTKLVGPVNGLAVSGSQSGKYLLYSYTDNRLRLGVKNLSSKSVSEVTPATLAEKCAWSKKIETNFICGVPIEDLGGEPDNWYKGKTQFNDNIWNFDTVTEVANLVIEPEKQFGVKLDVYSPMISPDESYMVYMNKTDLSLWALGLR